MILMIYGSGGLGQEIFELAVRNNAESNCWREMIYINDFEEEGYFQGVQRIHFDSIKNKYNVNEIECIIAVGEPTARKMLWKRVEEAGLKMTTIIDKSAIISPSAKIENGTIIRENVVIGPNVIIGKNTLVQPFACIGHNTIVGNHSVFSVFFSPGGECIIGDEVYTGMQVSLKERIKIGNNAIIAMGAAVFRDVADGEVIAGNPGRVTKGNSEHKVFRK